MHAAQQQRVVGHEQVRAERPGLLDDRQGGVDREVDAAHRLREVAGDQAHLVPGLGGLGRVEALEGRDDVDERQHVGPAGLEPTTPAV